MYGRGFGGNECQWQWEVVGIAPIPSRRFEKIVWTKPPQPVLLPASYTLGYRCQAVRTATAVILTCAHVSGDPNGHGVSVFAPLTGETVALVVAYANNINFVQISCPVI
jgi:hypothetical protein